MLISVSRRGRIFAYSAPTYDTEHSLARTKRPRHHSGLLGVALAQWMARDDSKAEPRGPARAANTAMDDEIRASDDAAGARVDALLAERQAT
jgi:hypothetical protein